MNIDYKWTRTDERELQRLQEKKKRTHDKHYEHLAQLVLLTLGIQGSQAKGVTDAMILKADDFRDRLKPFDSGVRDVSAGVGMGS